MPLHFTLSIYPLNLSLSLSFSLSLSLSISLSYLSSLPLSISPSTFISLYVDEIMLLTYNLLELMNQLYCSQN